MLLDFLFGTALAATLTVNNCDNLTVVNPTTIQCGSAPPPPPPPPPPSTLCAQFSDVVQVQVPWGNNGAPSYFPNPNVRFSAQTVLVLVLTVPAVPGNYATPTFAGTVAEYQGPPTFRNVRLSRKACDFSNQTSSDGVISGGDGNTAGATARVGLGTQMLPGQTYYLNVRNWAQGFGWTCSSATCPIIVGWQWPR